MSGAPAAALPIGLAEAGHPAQDQPPEWHVLLPRGPLVTALAGTPSPLRSRIRQVPDDGVLYWEVDRRERGCHTLTPGRAFDLLRRHGLTPTAAYWIKPGFPNRQMYLPLAAPGAFRWYLNTLFRTDTMRRRLLPGLIRRFALDRFLGAAAPCFAVTAVRGAARPPAIVEAVGAAAAWHGGRAHPLVVAHTPAEWSRIAVLLFGEEAAPSAVLKLSRAAIFSGHVTREHRVLQQLGEVLPPSLRRSIPRSRLLDWDDRCVAIETPVGGTPLSSRTGGATGAALRDLQLAAAWLTAFHRDTQVQRPPAAVWLAAHLLDGLCRQYADIFTLTHAEGRLFDRMRQRLNTCLAVPLPIGWQHTDFGPWNVYRDGNRINVIDWEVARIGPGLPDLLYFVSHWASMRARRCTADERAEDVVGLFCRMRSSDSMSAGIRESVAGYMQRLGVHASLLPFLLVYTFVEQALDRCERVQALGRTPGARSSNPYTACVAAMGEQADALFPEGGSR